MTATTAAPSLVFYDKTHRYKLDGEWVPGVTTILGVLNKPALPKWAATSVAEYVADNREAVEHLYTAGRGPMVAALKEMPWQTARDAAGRGTRLHDIAEQIINGAEVDVTDELVPVVENAIRFMEDWDITPILVEAPVASRQHKYAGKLDLLASYTHPLTRAAGTGIFDWKSGKRIYSEACFQLNAYGHADGYGDNLDPLPQVDAAFGVHIRADGYDCHPLPYSDEVFTEFLTIRATFDIAKRAEGDWKIPGSGYVGVAVQPPTEDTP
jgi:hypothetical protein